MRQGARAGIRCRSVSEIPEPIGNCSSGTVGEVHCQRPKASEGTGAEAGLRHRGADAGHSVRVTPGIGSEDNHIVAEEPCCAGRKFNKNIGDAVTRQVEWAPGQDAERAAVEARHDIAGSDVAHVRKRKTGLRGRAHHHNAQIQCGRLDIQSSGSQAVT